MDALLGLEPAIISAEISRLENSIKHLLESNSELLEAEETESDAEEKKVFSEARQENEDTMFVPCSYCLGLRETESTFYHSGYLATDRKSGSP